MADLSVLNLDGTNRNVKDASAVRTVANQGLTDTQKANARANIGAGTSSFSGNYNDLSNKPTIPTVNNATLTIQKNGTNVQTFTANAASDVTANITMSKSDVGLGNVGNFKAVSTVASQGLTDTEKANARANIGAGTSSFSGSYNDLSNKPTIPTVNNATLTIQKNGTNVQTFTANQSSNATANITVPTKVSELTNDSGYTTNTGTVTQVKVGSTAYNPSSGVVSLPSYPTVPSAASSAPGDITTGTASAGSSGNYARQDHTHKIATASTSAYGATKLNSATNSTSTSEAATPSAVKAAYDLAASKGTGTVNSVKCNGVTQTISSGAVNIDVASNLVTEEQWTQIQALLS